MSERRFGVLSTGVLGQQEAAALDDATIERMCAAYAKATGYYVEFHPGLKSESADRMREGMRAALSAYRSLEGGVK